MCISKERALKTIKRSLGQTQCKIRLDLNSPMATRNPALFKQKSDELKENQTVLELINLELMKFMDNPNTLN